MNYTSISEITPHPAYWINVASHEKNGGDISQMCRQGLGVTVDEFHEIIKFVADNYKPTADELKNHPVEDLTITGRWAKLSKREQDRIASSLYDD